MKRSGLSLMEVVIALALLVGSMAVLGQLIALGEKQAERSEALTDAQRIANNVLSEMLAEIEPIEPVEFQPAAVDSKWLYSVDIEPVGSAGLLCLTVRVFERGLEETIENLDPGGNELIEEKESTFHLTRWIDASRYDIDSDFLNDMTTDGDQPSLMDQQNSFGF